VRIEDCHGEHSNEPAKHRWPPLGVGCKDNLRIRIGAKGVTALTKFAPQFQEVVYLAVQDEPETTLPGSHRLMPSNGNVEN
jgi:hypothetical protein